MPNRGQQGTGRHPHKSTSEPRQSPGKGGQESTRESAGRGGESSDLKSREYRDKNGEIHHHTRTYERDHKGKH